MRNLYDQTQIRADHQRSRFFVALFDLGGEFDLLLGSEKRDLPDLAQVNLYSGIAIFSGHKAFHEKG
jgi:hypothetical protein